MLIYIKSEEKVLIKKIVEYLASSNNLVVFIMFILLAVVAVYAYKTHKEMCLYFQDLEVFLEGIFAILYKNSKKGTNEVAEDGQKDVYDNLEEVLVDFYTEAGYNVDEKEKRDS